jgi:hypothetical protein
MIVDEKNNSYLYHLPYIKMQPTHNPPESCLFAASTDNSHAATP